MPTYVAAVDCGATSVRVCRVDLDGAALVPDVVHRATHAPVLDETGHLRWDWSAIVAAVEEGLSKCLELAPLASIGIDTWAVDYGLLDGEGRLLSAPYSYRDRRTDGYFDLVQQFGAAEMYRVNGLQLQPFNTVFQLATHDRGELARAERLLWLPELLVHRLTGAVHTERTSAGCSGLVDVSTGTWSSDLLDLAGIEPELLGAIETGGRVVGQWRDVPVVLVAGHDTASAVVGMGPVSAAGSAFVASGTWMLAGVERPQPDRSEWARVRNFTNEAAALSGFRFLRNVTGFWLLEQCRSAWALDGRSAEVGELLAAAESVGRAVPLVDVDDESLRAAADMLAAYTALGGLARDADPGLITRSIVESIAAATAGAIVQLSEVAEFEDVVLFGGAARINLLRNRLAERVGRPVRVGAAEAAALGNAVVQGVAIGVFDSVATGRAKIGGG